MNSKLYPLLLLALSACGDEPEKHVVMVIDTGFDLDHPVFKGRVAATYSQVCDPTPARGLVDLLLPDFEALSAQPTCRLEAGLPGDISPRFDEILSDKERWNQDIREKSVGTRFQGDKPAFDNVVEVVTGESGAFNYHGTATAGLVAYENDNVELVLVGSSTIASPMVLNMLACPTAGEIQARVDSLTDPDHIETLVNTPPGTLERDFQDVVVRHGVSMVSASFGSLAREGLENVLAARGCPDLDLSAYYDARAAIVARREEAQAPTSALAGPLLVRSAGNSGVQINSLKDKLDCAGSPSELVIGSVDATGARSSFSNHGDCVDAYMLGEDVVVAAPAGFLSITSGTSFSTPLMARYLTLAFAPGTSSSEMRAGLLASLEPDETLGGEPAPAELAARNPDQIGAAQYALTEADNPTLDLDRLQPTRVFLADPLFSFENL